LKITSYNITDVGYHYVGLRVLSGLPLTELREGQINAISKSILKYANDKAKRFMLPEPKGTFETIGEKVCQELVHLKLAQKSQGSYELTENGTRALELLNNGKYADLRRIMVMAHFETYHNLRALVKKHIEIGTILRPIIESSPLMEINYIENLLSPTFGANAAFVANNFLNVNVGKSPKNIENLLCDIILNHLVPEMDISVSLFRSLCDRLVSLRLLNVARTNINNCLFYKSYSPCLLAKPIQRWHLKFDIPISLGDTFLLYFSEPSFDDNDTHQEFVKQIIEAFSATSSYGGYFDIPDIRDFVCENMKRGVGS